MIKWLKEVGKPSSRAPRSATRRKPRRRRSSSTRSRSEFTEPTGIEVEVEIVPLEQVLAKATQDVQGQLGTYDVYYLDQSWMATFSQDTHRSARQYYKDKPESGDAEFRLGRLLQAAGRRPRHVQRQVGRHSLRHSDLHPDVSQGHAREARIKVPTDLDEFIGGGPGRSPKPRRRNGIFGTGLQAKSGHYSLECDWTACGVGPWRLDLRQGQEVHRQ